MDLGLAGKKALISGSSGGIGEAVALSLAQEGAEVILNGRSVESVEAAIGRLRAAVPGAVVFGLVADLGTAEGCSKAAAELPADALDILVNNLGIYEPVDFFDATDAQWQRLIEVNVMSGVRLARHFLKGMITRGTGRVIFMASESGLNPAPEMAHYSATKTMQISVSRNLAELTKGTDVTVNAILPGPVNTDGVGTFIADLFPELPREEAHRKFMRENRPTSLIQRLTRPEEIGDFVCFIASARASAVNGAALRVDGGMVRSVV
ncbi:SDR family NAD(P)-dependent oxidoreductase [Neotabrizicola sp. VNH66]|uniref:SDR family NAD(P)-dependent oxidoreductase n=1 Tax=Neotabrizicola sp. VNH66 TaxID=3400918 RepID=UPI003BFDC61B